MLRGESSGEFSVQSAYKLLHGNAFFSTTNSAQDDSTNFYKKLWKLQVPSKIKIMLRKTSWYFLPTLANLFSRRLVVDALCPRYSEKVEDFIRIFQECPGFLSVRTNNVGRSVAPYGLSDLKEMRSGILY